MELWYSSLGGIEPSWRPLRSGMHPPIETEQRKRDRQQSGRNESRDVKGLVQKQPDDHQHNRTEDKHVGVLDLAVHEALPSWENE